jgi:hypothetical protein
MTRLHKAFRAAAILAVGMALLSCAPRPRVLYAPPPAAPYEPSLPVARGPLPPVAYVRAPAPPRYWRPPSGSHRASTYARAEVRPQPGSRLVWSTSPRWAAVKKKIPVSATKPDPQAKFKAAQTKAAKVGVENLTKEDIEGLTSDHITELRGY